MPKITNIETLNKIIETTFVGDFREEFKDSLINVLVQEGMADIEAGMTAEEKNLLLTNFIHTFKRFLVSTDVYQKIQKLQDQIERIHTLREEALNPGGHSNKIVVEKLESEITSLSNDILKFVERHRDNVPLPMVAKAFTDITKERYSGLNTFQIIKDIFRYVFGAYRHVIIAETEVQIGNEEPQLVNIWQNQFLMSKTEYFIPKDLLYDHLTRLETSNKLLSPTIKDSKWGKDAYNAIMPKIIGTTFVTNKKREELDPHILNLLEQYEAKNDENDPKNEIEGYLFSAFWFHLYGKILEGVTSMKHAKALEYFGTIAGNVFVSTSMSALREDKPSAEQKTSQILMAIVGSYLMVNTFFHHQNIIQLQLENAPLRKIGSNFILSPLLVELANMFLKEAFPHNTSKINEDNIIDVLEFVFSSEASRLYTFSNYRFESVIGRINSITSDENKSLQNFDRELLKLFQDFDKSKNLQRRITARQPTGRGALASLDATIKQKA